MIHSHSTHVYKRLLNSGLTHFKVKCPGINSWYLDKKLTLCCDSALSMIPIVILLVCNVGVISFKIRPDKSCGIEASSNLIHHNPWVVFLEYWREDYRTEIRCTATLIDSLHVITAGHCIKKSKYTRLVARLGEYNLAKSVDCVDDICSSNVIQLKVIDEVVHPDYDGKANDIAVLRLESEAPYTDFIRPVCLPSGELQPKITFVASGWGEIPRLGYYSSIKKIIPLPLWEREACITAYKNFEVPPHVICAGGIEGVDTCRGDSGGPLLWVREKIELWGVTSIGNVKCGTKDSPGIYMNVADYLEWILAVVETYNEKYD